MRLRSRWHRLSDRAKGRILCAILIVPGAALIASNFLPISGLALDAIALASLALLIAFFVVQNG